MNSNFVLLKSGFQQKLHLDFQPPFLSAWHFQPSALPRIQINKCFNWKEPQNVKSIWFLLLPSLQNLGLCTPDLLHNPESHLSSTQPEGTVKSSVPQFSAHPAYEPENSFKEKSGTEGQVYLTFPSESLKPRYLMLWVLFYAFVFLFILCNCSTLCTC